jgi:hypothetical protein
MGLGPYFYFKPSQASHANGLTDEGLSAFWIRAEVVRPVNTFSPRIEHIAHMMSYVVYNA